MPKPAQILQGSTGQALVEYALILVLFTIVLILAINSLGKGTDDQFSKVNSSLEEVGYGK